MLSWVEYETSFITLVHGLVSLTTLAEEKMSYIECVIFFMIFSKA